MDSDGQVYLGAWTNWSRGRVMGATLTMTREQGNFLIAFTAFFIPFVVSRLWKSFAMLFHQCYSTSDPRDAVHHQRQVLLRSSSSPETSLMSFARMIWIWQGTAKRPWLRVFPRGPLVVSLHRNSHSGRWILFEDLYSRNAILKRVQASLSAPGSLLTQFQPQLQIITHPAPSVQTFVGMICAPLVTRERIQNITFSNRNYTTYNYGPMKNPADPKHVNYTYVVPDVDTQYARSPTGVLNNNNMLISARNSRMFRGSVTQGGSAFIPHHELIRQDGDVTLVFLSGNGLIFVPQANDDWYRATVPNGRVYHENVTDMLKSYRPEEAASPLGCVEQYQWCRDPSRGQCGDLASSLDATYSAAPWFGLTDKDLDPERPTRLVQARFRPIAWSSKALYGSLKGTSGSLMLPVSDHATRWWSIVLAGFQTSFVSTARGISNSTLRPDNPIRPANEYEWDICRNQVRLTPILPPTAGLTFINYNQKIRSALYSSFSIFGLIFTYSMGALIVIVSFTISPLLCFLQKRGLYNKYAYLEWEGHTAIQLHRVAQDQCGHGRWSHCDEEIPITRPDDMLAAFDISDPEHHMLASKHDPVPEETSSEEKSQGSRRDQAPQESSLEPSDEGSSRYTSFAVRRATADGHLQGPRSDRFPGIDEDLDGNQTRRNTAP
ncbi:hypothetical protein PG991_008345 [Apiospora marii]|uniref:Uncharacterized protein n=1 Tax=Apiospora marii TaxID=335849 RepID=A0ABR1RRU1_9PEZI